MCNLETSTSYAPGQIANFTATQGLPDRAHCPEENLYVGGAGYDPKAKMQFVSLQPITAQNRVNTNYQPGFSMGGGANYNFGAANQSSRYQSIGLESFAQTYSPPHPHESATEHANHTQH